MMENGEIMSFVCRPYTYKSYVCCSCVRETYNCESEDQHCGDHNRDDSNISGIWWHWLWIWVVFGEELGCWFVISK